ncbi:hypothetical protein [Aurantiacibacter poecillastricola]|uniref:hypothetical protein n=1 Tax=Aurantiacibacter poecillastricola TaxID=3064385 RepID=UPI00273E3E05|nr:hypothetical protein [Aurantiacibacter sp. 219JJ12-13]MDP5260457.1 hypothetical protein [Aurantiacibacter sp. 219JJ12-13]
MTRLLALTAASAFALGLASTPAAAQDEGGDRVNQVIIFGDDECPESSGDTITVCARLDESERYRIPPNLRTSTSPENESWTQRALALEAVGDFGPLSCTPVGAGGDLGCTMEMIEAAYAERANSSDVRFAELIAEERAERLATIDAEAAATQARVEELEEAELQRRREAQSAPIPGEEFDSATPPQTVADPDRVPPRDLPPPSFDDDEEQVPLDAAPPAEEPSA